MHTYEIINPSDPYTLKATSLEVAVLATVMLGQGMYGLEDETGETVFPPLAGEEWMTNTFGCSGASLLNRCGFAAVADCLATIVLCDLNTRPLYDQALAAMTDPQARAAWEAMWHDRKRSSMNDIGARAKCLAEGLRVKASAAAQGGGA